MSGLYDDILYEAYPYPTKRKKMAMVDRGAQFSPFAALTGYDAAIQESGRQTVPQVELDVDGEGLLDETLRSLYQIQQETPEVQILYFEPDERKSGGAYRRVSGKVRKVDSQKQILVMMDGLVVPFSAIRELCGAQLERE